MGTRSEKIYRARIASNMPTAEQVRRQRSEQRKKEQEERQALLREIKELLPLAIAVLDAEEWLEADAYTENRYSLLGPRTLYSSAPGVTLFRTICDCRSDGCGHPSTTYSLGVDHTFYMNSRPVRLRKIPHVLPRIRDSLKAIASRVER